MTPHEAPTTTRRFTGTTRPRKSRVFQDQYAHPVWQVYYGDMWVGAAHSRKVADVAARIAYHHAEQVCPTGVSQLYLIQHVMVDMPHQEQWEPAKVYYNHQTWHEQTLNPLRERLAV